MIGETAEDMREQGYHVGRDYGRHEPREWEMSVPDSTPPGETAESAQAPVPKRSEPYYRAPLPDAFIRFWTKYATFSGRASRAEYWWWFFVSVCVGLVLSFVGTGLQPMPLIATVLSGLWLAATAVPGTALTWRRAHDSNHSGWWAVPSLVVSVFYVPIGGFSVRALLETAIQNGDPVLGPIGIAVSVLAMLCAVQLFILTVLKPNPEGARFD